MVAIIATVRVKASLKMLGVVKAIYMGSRPRWRGLASTGKALKVVVVEEMWLRKRHR